MTNGTTPVAKQELDEASLAKIRSIQRVASLIDLTSLNDADDAASVAKLAESAVKNGTCEKVAAICIWKEFIKEVREKNEELKIATVVNFPKGERSIETVKAEIQTGLEAGADEIDLVIPYHDYVNSAEDSEALQTAGKNSRDLVQAAADLCHKPKGTDRKIKLKVIIESGELAKFELIKRAAKDAIEAGADFVKTSTGKVKVGATLDAAKAMMEAIKEADKKAAQPCGFKASGGIRSYADALEYIELAESILGAEFVKPETFRFGVSGLLGNLVKEYEAVMSKDSEKDGEPAAKRRRVEKEPESTY